MADLRSNLRKAGRFAGWDGHGQYESGYQYRPPDRVDGRIGPWDRLHPKGMRDLPKNALSGLRNGILVDGMIIPAWRKLTGSAQDDNILGAYEFSLIMGTYHVIFYKDATDGRLKFELRSQSVSTDVDTGLTVTGDRAVATNWRNSIFFTHPDLADVYQYDVLTATQTALGLGHSAKEIFMLDNNLVLIYQNGIPFVAKWSVDGTPTDFAGYGSGSKILPGHIGVVRGVAPLRQGRLSTYMIAGSYSGQIMSPTGMVPAFSFEDTPDFNGLLYDFAIAGVNDTVYYVNIERRLAGYRPGGHGKVGEGEDTFDTNAVVAYSRRLGSIIVSSPDRGTLLLRPSTNQWISQLDEDFDYITDSPANSAVGQVLGLKNSGATAHTRVTLDIGAAEYTMPALETGMIKFEQPMMVSHVDIQHTDIIDYAPLAVFSCMMEDGSIMEITFDEPRRSYIQIKGTYARYWVDQILRGIQIETMTPSAAEGFYSGVLNASGNYEDDGLEGVGHQRGDMNASGNIVPSAASTGYTYGGFNASGNMSMVENLDQWPKEAAIDYISIGIRSTQSERHSQS